MTRRAAARIAVAGSILARCLCAADVPVDLSGHTPTSGVGVAAAAGLITARWPLGGTDDDVGVLALDLRGPRPIVASLSVAPATGGQATEILRELEPAFFLTVGSRKTPPAKPPDQTWAVFFDSPASRPHETFLACLDARAASVASRGRRTTIRIDGLTAGSFAGRLEVTLCADCPLILIEAVLSTGEDLRAYVYDAALLEAGGEGGAGWSSLAWRGTDGRMARAAVRRDEDARSLAVRHRLLAAESAGGSVAVFPPPHGFFFPRDLTDNLEVVWFGRGHLGKESRFGIGIRQAKTGGGGFVPWTNAPPGSEQRLGLFVLLGRGKGEDALAAALRYTRGDRYASVPGHLTFTSHWHMAVAEAALQRKDAAGGALAPAAAPVPEWVGIFKDMGVNAVHLGEFHGDGHQRDPGPLRLAELEALFAECRRLSGDDLLVLPGEELNLYLGLAAPERHPGHWMSFFPRPVYWTVVRGEGQPFVEEHPRYGRLYHVGSREDMVRLLIAEKGLAWTAHPRIKASSWTPDIFKDEDFFTADFWLGAAWKAMPADLSEPRLGSRPLALLDDMASWGRRKYLVGEVDVFKIDRTHELFGHMNVNYVRLDRLPRFDAGWQPILDALSAGRFFVTTGEILIPSFQAAGKSSGETVDGAAGRVRVEADVEWTFPLAFAELVVGGAAGVEHSRLDLSDTGPFGSRRLAFDADLAGRRWLRLEVWDLARNGAFTQPVWIR